MKLEQIRERGIYTLAQNRTEVFDNLIKDTIISGTGTPINGNPAVLKRANKKVITNALILAMIDITKENNEIEWKKRYWNTFHCQTTLVSLKDRYYTDYCKNRWCATCSGIRKAYLLNKYYPIISTWEEPHHITLTLKSVKADKLNKRIKEMIKAFSKIIDRCNKRNRRGKGMKIKCVKSLESNYNATKKWYNPHYHIITPNRVMGVYLKQEWKKEWNKNDYLASESAQKVQKIDNNEKGLIEVIKYGAKILSDPDPKHKKKRKKGDMTGLNIYANALHTIYKAMDKHRLYGSIGFKLPKEEKEEVAFKMVSDFETWKYKPKQMDWVNTENENCLTDYEIDSYLDYILKTCINKELH